MANIPKQCCQPASDWARPYPAVTKTFQTVDVMQNETCKKVPKKENLDINRNLCVEGKNGIFW